MVTTPDTSDWNLNPKSIPINMENFQFVWLDKDVKTSTSPLNARYYRELIVKLNSAVQFFTEPLKCINFMKTIKKEKIILITSGLLADEVLTIIHSYNPLSAAFIFCFNRNRYMHLLTKYNKIIGIFVDRGELLDSIKRTIENINKQIFSIVIFDSNNPKLPYNLSKQYANFLWPQLLVRVLKEIPSEKDEINKFAQLCNGYYKDNSIELKNIAVFEGKGELSEQDKPYTSDESIQWYTKECFLYKTINKALQCDNIELLCSFPFLVSDLCRQLETEKQKLNETGVLTVYRGMVIPNTQVDYYNDMEGKLVLLKGFTSTTRKRDIALGFSKPSGVSSTTSDYEVGVLYEISVDPKEDILLADIVDLSAIKMEGEVLFGPNTVFYVNRVNFDQAKRLLNVNMIAKDVLKDCLIQYLRIEQEETIDCQRLAYLGRLLFDKLGEIDRAEKYFNIILKRLPEDHETIPAIHCQLGDLNLLEKNFSTALDYYERAVKYFRRPPSDDTNIVCCLLKIVNALLSQEYSNINQHHSDFELESLTSFAPSTYRSRLDVAYQALKLGKQALELLDKTSEPDLARIAKVHQMMGKTYLVFGKIFRDEGKIVLSQNEYIKAGEHLETAYTMFEDITPLESGHLVSVLGDMSNFHDANGDFFEARQLLRKQLHLAETYLPLDHQKQGVYLENFIRLYKSHNLKDKAMKVVWDSLEKYQAKLGERHPVIAQTLISIGYYDRACRILFKIKPIDECSITRCLHVLGRQKHLNKKSIELFQEWLNYLVENYPTTERRIGDVLRQFANICNDMGKFDEAFTYLSESLPIYKHHQDHLNLRTVEDFMRHIEQGIGRLHIANIVCDDNWENGILSFAKPIDARTLSDPPSRPTNSQMRSALLKFKKKYLN